MDIYLKNKRTWSLAVLLGCVMGLRGMSHEPRVPELTMVQHQELLDFVRGARESGMAFPGICALCVEEFPKYSKLAQMYAYLSMSPIERNQYEDAPELKQLRPEEFLRCCLNFSFACHENALKILARLFCIATTAAAVPKLADVAIELIYANDIVFMRHLMRFMRDNGLMVHKSVGANFFCDTVLTGSLTGVRCLLQTSHFNLNTKCFCAGHGKIFPLLVAVMRGSLPMVALLLRMGADPELQLKIKSVCPVACTMEKGRAHFDADPRLAEMVLIPDVPDRKGETAHPGFDVYKERDSRIVSALSCARDYNRTFAACADNQYPAIIACLERAIAKKHAPVAPRSSLLAIIEPSDCVGDVPGAGSSRGVAMVASASAGHVDQSSGGEPAGALRAARTEPGELVDRLADRQPSIVDFSGWGCGCGCHVKKVKKVVEKDKDKKDKKKK